MSLINFRKYNIGTILSAQFRTYRNFSNGKIAWGEIIMVYLIPLILAYVLRNWGFDFFKYIDKIIGFVSIFGGFLFNLLAIVQPLLVKVKEDSTLKNYLGKESLKDLTNINPEETKKLGKVKIVKELNTNIAYTIIICIVIVLSSLIAIIEIDWPENINVERAIHYSLTILEVILTALCIHLVIMLLLLVNRVTLLLEKF